MKAVVAEITREGNEDAASLRGTTLISTHCSPILAASLFASMIPQTEIFSRTFWGPGGAEYVESMGMRETSESEREMVCIGNNDN